MILTSSEYNKAHYQKNKEKRKIQSSLWAKANRDKKIASCEKWRLANLATDAANRAMARARKRQASPLWADKEKIQEFYTLAAWSTRMFGFSWDVDHIVPLKGKLVCGLHVENNLRVIPTTENRKKWNYWDIENSSTFFQVDQRMSH